LENSQDIKPKPLKEGDDSLAITCEILAKSRVDSPGGRVYDKDGAGKPVTGTNTKLLGKSLVRLMETESRSI